MEKIKKYFKSILVFGIVLFILNIIWIIECFYPLGGVIGYWLGDFGIALGKILGFILTVCDIIVLGIVLGLALIALWFKKFM